MKRRRFFELATGSLAMSSCRSAPALSQWKGIAMGIAVSVQYRGDANLDEALQVVAEAEEVLSLWSADSALSQLNRDGFLKNPPQHLLACLKKARELFEASEGGFDPSIHSFLEWAKAQYEAGREPQEGDMIERLKRVDFNQVEFSETRVKMAPGVTLSFNAIAQGYLTDLFAESFTASSALVHFGEYRVIGSSAWPIEVKGRTHQLSRSLAVSSGSGQRLSATSAANHLIDPKTGKSPPPKKVSAVEADEAWLADGLSTIVAIGGGIPAKYASARVI